MAEGIGSRRRFSRTSRRASPGGYWIAYFSGLVIVGALAMLIARRIFHRKGPRLGVG